MKGSVTRRTYDIMINMVHSALSGTKTEENLHTAFSDEATAHMKYRLYAAAARESGNEALARLFEDFANNESEHAELILEYLDGITDDKGNLEALIAAEDYARGVSYPEFANIAMSEGFSEIAEKMRNIAKAEERHSKVLSETLERLASTPETLPAAMLCPVCGYVHEGDSLPDRCPLCSRPSFNFMPM